MFYKYFIDTLGRSINTYKIAMAFSLTKKICRKLIRIMSNNNFQKFRLTYNYFDYSIQF